MTHNLMTFYYKLRCDVLKVINFKRTIVFKILRTPFSVAVGRFRKRIPVASNTGRKTKLTIFMHSLEAMRIYVIYCMLKLEVK